LPSDLSRAISLFRRARLTLPLYIVSNTALRCSSKTVAAAANKAGSEQSFSKLARDVWQIYQGHLTVLEQKIRRLVIVVNVPDSHSDSRQHFEDGFENHSFAGNRDATGP
jgi:hypothetical protein